MNEAKLTLDIGADISQFEYSLARVRAEIKKVTKDIESATGAEFAKLSVDLTGYKRTEDTLARFGQFAQGTLGALKNTLATLKQERLEIPIGDTAKLEEWNRRIDETALAIKNIESLGRQKIGDIVEPAAINSIQYFREEIDILNKQKVSIRIDTAEGRAQLALINNTILYYKDLIKEANSIGESFDPVPDAAVNSINYFRQQIDKLKSKRATISIDTSDGRIQIAELTSEIDGLENKLKEAQSIGKTTEFIDLSTIRGLQARLREIDAKVIDIDITDEGEIARLNTEAAQLREQLARLQGLSFDSKGTLQRGAAKARQSLVNLGLVAQDLPFGFIAIQNNIPNLVQSFADLSAEAKKTGVSIGSQLASQFKGTAGAILGVGLAVSAATAGITYLIQTYGSLGNAIDVFLGQALKNQEKIKSLTESFKTFNDTLKDNNEIVRYSEAEVSGQVAVIEALANGATDLSKSEQERGKYLTRLKDLDEKYFGQLSTGVKDIKKIQEATDQYTQSLIIQSKVTGLSTELSNVTTQLEQQKTLYGQLEQQRVQAAATFAKNARVKGGADIIDIVEAQRAKKQLDGIAESIKQNKDNTKFLTQRRKELTDAVGLGVEELKEFNKGITDTPKETKIKFDFDIPKLEEFLQFEKFYQLDNALKRLDDYADILLNVKAKESERTAVLKSLQAEQTKVLGSNATFFNGLQIGVTNYQALTQAVSNYALAIQQAILDQQELFAPVKTESKFKISEYIASGLKGVNFNDLDSDIIKDEFDKIKELAKGLPKDVLPSFEQFQTQLKEITTLESFKFTEGTLGFDAIIAIAKEQLQRLKQTIVDAQIQQTLDKISGKSADQTQGKTPEQKMLELAGQIESASAKLKQTIARDLEKPFRDFFDTLLDEGKINFDSFVDLFKDMIKRIASQLIASGIASLITKVLFPQAAVGQALAGTAAGTGGASGILKWLIGVFGGGKKSLNDINFGGVGSGGMQLAGQVVFTQRGSDLVGVLNRTNGTINRVG